MTEAQTKDRTKTVHQHLFAAATAFTPEGGTKFKAQSAKESDAAYHVRMLERISALPTHDYDRLLVDSLTPEDQERYHALPEGSAERNEVLKGSPVLRWFEGAVEEFNNSRPIPAPEGFISAFRDPAARAAAAETKEKAEPKAAAPRKRAEVTMGKVIRRALIEDQSLSTETIQGLLATAGFRDLKPTTIGSYISDTLATLAVAAEMGKFTPNPPAA